MWVYLLLTCLVWVSAFGFELGLELATPTGILGPCRSTNFIATNARKIANSSFGPAVGKGPSVHTAALPRFPNGCPCSPLQAEPAPMLRRPVVSNDLVRAVATVPAESTSTDRK